MKTKLSLTLLLSLVFCLLSFPQVPQGFNYQAIARDAVSGNPITDPIDVKIAIIAADASTVIREEQHSAVDPNEHGLFSLVIGQGTWLSGLANFSDIDWTVTPKYIRTSIYYDGGWKVLDPAQLWSVPYAIRSKDSEQWQSNGTDIYRTSGKIGIGNTSPNATLDIVTQAIGGPEVPLKIKVSDDANSYFQISNGTNGGSQFIPSLFGYNGRDNRGCLGLIAQTSSAYDNNLVNPMLGFNARLIDEPVVNRPLFAWANYTDTKMIMLANGNLGIGNTSPSSKLSVQPPDDWSDDIPLFEVKNKYGIAVLAVYNNGVKINIEHDPDGVKGPKGGFAIGGYDYTKGGTVTLMNVTPDSIRFNINNDNTKGPKGGFAIGGFDYTKGDINEDFMYVTPQVSNAGIYNTILGFKAARYITTSGDYNTILGYQSVYNTVFTGQSNVVLGYQSGYSMNSGSQNVLVGYKSGYSLTSGYKNSYIGHLAGWGSGTAAKNVAIGDSAGYSVQTGLYNVCIGNSTSQYDNGYGNTFIGYRAGAGVSSSSQSFGNVFIGYKAGEKCRGGSIGSIPPTLDQYYGSGNVCIGTGSGNSLSALSPFTAKEASDNVFLGTASGLKTTQGKNNIFIGREAGYNNTIGEGNIFIGYQAGYNANGSNKLYIDNSNTSSPLIYGEFDNDFLRFNGTVELKSYAPYISFYESDFPKYWVMGGDGSKFWLGEDNTNSENRRITVLAGGNIGIGTTTPGYLLQVGNAGDGTEARANAWKEFSDARLKTNLVKVDNALEKTQKLNGYYFFWNTELDNKRQTGLIAQEVEKVFPEIVSEGSDGFLSLDYGKLAPLLVEAIKEQQSQIESQNKENQRLKSELESLKERMALLESILGKN